MGERARTTGGRPRRRLGRVLPILVAAAGVATACVATRPGGTQGEPAVPELVGEGLISTPEGQENFPAIDPVDGSLWYSAYEGEAFNSQRLMRAPRAGSGWGAPAPVPIAPGDTFGARAPRFAPDGSQLFVTTHRPRTAGAARNMDLWVADRAGSGWSAFRPLPEPIVTDGFEIHPSASRAALFFAARRPGGLGASDVYRVPRRSDGGWAAVAEHLPSPVNDSLSQPDLYVAPDESFMLLVVTVRRDSTEHDDLFYVERQGDGWSVPRQLPPSVNSPGYEYGPWVTADGETLYFNSDRRGSADLYRVSMRALGLGRR